MEITLEQLSKLFPSTKRDQLAKFVDPLNETFDRFDINTPLRVRAFLAQVGHECAGFNIFTENLNYSADALVQIFGKYYDRATAAKYARNPEMIANRVYANRMGNGPESSGDGWRYRGRGGIQVTGSNNYHAFADYMEMSVDDVINYLNTPEGQMMVSGWYWTTNNLNALADKGDMTTLTKRINGGLNGLDDRMAIWNRSASIITS